MRAGAVLCKCSTEIACVQAAVCSEERLRSVWSDHVRLVRHLIIGHYLKYKSISVTSTCIVKLGVIDMYYIVTYN